MTPRAPDRTHGRRAIGIAVGLLLIAVVVIGSVAYRVDESQPAADLTVGWGGSEGHPSCVYDATNRTVEATLTVQGTAPSRTKMSVTVTAYADENTSRPVGSTTRTVPAEHTVHRQLVIPIQVRNPPHVGEDGETACTLAFEYVTY